MMRIGEFSRLGKTTIKTLRHYDDMGLLTPARIDDATGYRYYTTAQLVRLHEIVALRQMGFSIPETVDILSGGEAGPILAARRAQLVHEQRAVTDRLLRLDHYIQSREGGQTMQYQAVVKEIPEYTIFYYETTLGVFDDIYREIAALKEKLSRSNADVTCVEPEYMFNEYLDGEHREKDIHIAICQAVDAPGVDADGVVFKKLPGTRGVSVLHRGPYETLRGAYAYAMQWIEANGYKKTGPEREQFIDGIWNQEDEANWLTEIQIPVRQG